jgi:CubicO group peptidase (beta-lactamase class C family)
MNPRITASIAFCSLFALFASTALAQPVATLDAKKQAAVDQAVQAEMEKQQVVGVAIGVLQDREIVYLKGYGLADRERKLPVATKTVFNWASNSKPVLAMLIMMLFGQGQIDLDADVRTYVPEFPMKTGVIKVRHLLCHQSGLPHYGKGVVGETKNYPQKLPFLGPVLALDRFSKSPLQFQPGEKVMYSSYAYVLLSAAAQKAGKQPIFEQVERKIARPLGMTSFQMDMPFARQPNWAAGYAKSKDGKVEKAPDVAHYWKHGAGAYKSNVEDFARWARALLQRKLLSKKVEEVMWQIQKLNDGADTPYGLGFKVDRRNGRLRISHNGKQEETTTRLVIYPEDGHGVVVMSNCDYATPDRFSTVVYRALSGN